MCSISLEILLLLVQPYHRKCRTKLAHLNGIFAHCFPHGTQIATETASLSRSHAPGIDEWSQRWPDALRCVEEDVTAYFANALYFLYEGADFLGRGIGTLKEIVEVTV